MENGGDVNTDSVSRVRLLEARYIELLEKRVADLESLVAKTSDGRTKITVGSRGKDTKLSAKDLTSNDRIEQFRPNGEHVTGDKRTSINSNPDSQPLATRIRFRNVRYNDDGVEETKDVSEDEILKVGHAEKRKEEDDIVWTSRFGENRKYKWAEVQILSVELRDIFRVLFAHDPRMHVVADSDNEITLISPFEPLLQRWTKLEELARESFESDSWRSVTKKIGEAKRNSQTATVEQKPEKFLGKAQKDLVALMERVRSSPEVEAYLSAIEAAVKNSTIQFDNLWTIFPPGEIVYSTSFMKEDQIFVVKECSSYYPTESDSGLPKDNRQVCNLHCWSYDWNGKHFTRVPVLFKFEEFPGVKLINTLHCHPLRNHFTDDDQERKIGELKNKLIARGKLFREYCVRTIEDRLGEQTFEYDGTAISHGSGFQRLKNKQSGVRVT
ncbi:uncharacterized protein N0V89_004809 [Didymosphaeria variabile]|uniref:DUF7025 domain-containing protein n=1 Tax=Didymosphaeria variabile TaxID=1932322 RepID=A0A9W8XQ38_9PLEO|nr:uncharacterized protein N0V89_004809 [Didymosphaeria variabile]KAJ4356773.1 hypothetical protein N0V89_004809 [Didymosphaeria variabile]